MERDVTLHVSEVVSTHFGCSWSPDEKIVRLAHFCLTEYIEALVSAKPQTQAKHQTNQQQAIFIGQIMLQAQY